MMPRPKIARTRVQLRLRDDVLARVAALAIALAVSRTEIIETLIMKGTGTDNE